MQATSEKLYLFSKSQSDPTDKGVSVSISLLSQESWRSNPAATSRHLTSVEDRLEKFEIALRRLFPAGSVEEIVHNLVQDQDAQLAQLESHQDDTSMPEYSASQLSDPSLDVLDELWDFSNPNRDLSTSQYLSVLTSHLLALFNFDVLTEHRPKHRLAPLPVGMHHRVLRNLLKI